MSIPEYAKVTEKGIFHKKEYITVPLEKWEAKHVSCNEKNYLELATNHMEREILDFQRSISGQYFQNLKDQNKKLMEENKALKSSNEALKEFGTLEFQEEKQKNEKLTENNSELIKKIKRTLEKIPDESAELFKKEWNLEIELKRQKEQSHDLER